MGPGVPMSWCPCGWRGEVVGEALVDEFAHDLRRLAESGPEPTDALSTLLRR